MKLVFAIIPLFSLIALVGCKDKSTNPATQSEELSPPALVTIMGHTRNSDPKENYIPKEIIQSLKCEPNAIMLLGDLAFYTTKDSNVLENLSQGLDLNRPDILLAPGNHDIENRSILNRYFREEYPHVFRKDSLLLITLDSEIDSGSIRGDQLKRLEQILINNSDASSIIIGTHQLVWLQDNAHYQTIADSIINGSVGNCNYCLHENNFYEEVLPMITSVCPNSHLYFVAGDVGHKVTNYMSHFSDKITYIAIGNNGEKEFTTLQFYSGNSKHLEFTITSVNQDRTDI